MTTNPPTAYAISKATSSLTRKTVLVSMKTKMFSNSLVDPTAKRNMAATSNADLKALRVSKDIFDPRHLAAAKKVIGAARSEYYDKTLPWGDLGWRLLPTKLHFDFENKMRKFQNDLTAAVQAMDANYAGMVAAGQARLGNLAANVVYPDQRWFSQNWFIRWKYQPVPASGHFVADIAQQDLEDMRQAIEANNHEQMKETTRHLYQRIFDLTSHMQATLKDPDAKFKDSLVGNIQRLTEVLEPLNIAGDPEINKLASQLKASLATYSPDDLRKNETIRAQAATEAEQATNAVTSLLAKMGLSPSKTTATTQQDEED